MKRKKQTFAGLLRRSQQILTAKYEAMADAIPVAQVAILGALIAHGPLNHRGITAATFIDRSTLSIVLISMARAGLVAMVREERDLRSILVSHSPLGREVYKRASVALIEAERATLLTVPRSHRKPLIDALTRLTAEPVQ